MPSETKSHFSHAPVLSESLAVAAHPLAYHPEAVDDILHHEGHPRSARLSHSIRRPIAILGGGCKDLLDVRFVQGQLCR